MGYTFCKLFHIISIFQFTPYWCFNYTLCILINMTFLLVHTTKSTNIQSSYPSKKEKRITNDCTILCHPCFVFLSQILFFMIKRYVTPDWTYLFNEINVFYFVTSVRDDWSFDEQMAKQFRCQIKSFDPS